jgi:dephospho-CoA kinase
MLLIGLTGGIGSGKTTVARIFEVLGIPVYYADVAAKRIMSEDDNIILSVIKTFGDEAYKDGELNRSYLSTIVFSNADKLNLLNSIVHPATIKDAAEWIKKQTGSYIIKEAALLFESGSHQNLDYVIGIKSPLELRINRAMKRDGISYDEVMARMNKQMSEEKKLSLSDFVLVNDEEQLVLPQVLQLHEKFVSNNLQIINYKKQSIHH